MKILKLLKDYASTTDNYWLQMKLLELQSEINDAIYDAKIETINEYSKRLSDES